MRRPGFRAGVRAVPPAYAIAINDGDGQSATVLTEVATDPQVVVTLNGVPAAGLWVDWSTADDSSLATGPFLSTLTDGSGLAAVAWTMGPSTFNYHLTARVRLTGHRVVFTGTATAASAGSLLSVSVLDQSAVVDTPVAVPPVVKVVDALGNPVAGTTVTFAVTSGSGEVDNGVDTPGSSADVDTDALGLASVAWTMGSGAGPNSLTATAAGLNGSPVTFTANAVAAAPAQIAVTAGGAQTGVVAGDAAALATVFTVTDVGDNPIEGVTVAFAVVSGSGTLSVASAVTDASGEASVTYTTDTTVETATISGTFQDANGDPVAASTTIASTFGTATQLLIQTQPASNCQSGVALPGQPIIRIADANGNTVTSATDTITASIGTGDGSVSAGATKAAVAGVATFTALTITDANGGTDTLDFDTGALTTATSNPVTVAIPLPDQLGFATQPNNVATNVAGLNCTVEVRDDQGVKVPGATNAVTLELTVPGAATLSGSVTVNAVAGTATFTGLAVDVDDDYSLTATSPGLTPAVSNNFTVGGAPTALRQNWPGDVNIIAQATMDVHPIGDFPMHTVAQYPIGKFAANGNLALITDPTSPTGRSSVIRARYPSGVPGTPGGVGKWNYACWPSQTNTTYYSTFALSQVFKIVGNGSTYENQAAGTKLGFISAGNTSQDAQNFMWLNNQQAVQNTLTAWSLQFKQQDTLVSGQINRNQNNGFTANQLLVQLGVWYEMEIILTLNSLGSVTAGLGGFIGDGTMDVYLRSWNGSSWDASKHIMHYTNMCFRRGSADKGFKFYNNNCTWGGSGGAKTQTDDFYYAELTVGGKV